MSKDIDKLIYKLVDDLFDSMTVFVDGQKVFLNRNFESLSNFDKFYIAETLINKGYRKIENGIVVLSSERYSMFCELENAHIELTEEFRQEVRKETAREIFDNIMQYPCYNEYREEQGYLLRFEEFYDLVKKYGV